MPRTAPDDRLPKLIDAAAAAFVAGGFDRTQMDDIAERMGVSKGTIYNSVDSKESLLAAVLLYADHPERLPSRGPLPSVALIDLAATIASEMGAASESFPSVEGVESKEDIEELALGLFRMLEANRIRIMVLDRCAADLPELGGDWYDSGRYAVEDLWVDLLAERLGKTGRDNHRMLARTILELITLWAVKMPWDPAPRVYDLDAGPACARLVRDLVMGAAR